MIACDGPSVCEVFGNNAFLRLLLRGRNSTCLGARLHRFPDGADHIETEGMELEPLGFFCRPSRREAMSSYPVRYYSAHQASHRGQLEGLVPHLGTDRDAERSSTAPKWPS